MFFSFTLSMHASIDLKLVIISCVQGLPGSPGQPGPVGVMGPPVSHNCSIFMLYLNIYSAQAMRFTKTMF